MVTIKPFRALRPKAEYVSRVAALPYDVFTEEEARIEAEKDRLSFVNIDRPETQFPPGQNICGEKLYEKAAQLLQNETKEGIFIKEKAASFYIYELTYKEHRQTGIVGCASIEDYNENRIKKHEQTRREKEADRYQHIRTCGAQTGPIFLAYPRQAALDKIVGALKEKMPVYDFTASDGVRHRVWQLDDKNIICRISGEFNKIPAAYIADGHHRAASAVNVCKDMENEDGFMAVFFPHTELKIYPYYRVVKDLNGLTVSRFIEIISEKFDVTLKSGRPPEILEKGKVAFYSEGRWYILTKKQLYEGMDAVKRLDVSMLQSEILSPVLGITDIRNDKRIDFIGGIYGCAAIEKRCAEDMAAGFMTSPVTMEELFAVADSGALMPPKSTWFEPKLRSGIFIHELNKTL